MKKIWKNDDYVKVDDKNRFYYMLQQMQGNREVIGRRDRFILFKNVIFRAIPGAQGEMRQCQLLQAIYL